MPRMEITQMRFRLLKPLFIAIILYLTAGAIEAGILFAKGNDIASPEIINAGKKGIIFFSTLSTVILLRWIVSDAPFNFLRRYTVAPMLKSMINLLIYFGAAMILLNRLFGINLAPLLTTSAVLTALLALSLQETLKNLFTGLWINTERIVAKGDWVKISGKEGQIMEVTWRTTRLMTRGNDCIYIPNRLLAEDLLENYTFPSSLHIIEVEIGASYSDPPNKVKDLLISIAKGTDGLLTEPGPDVWVEGYSDFSIKYKLRAWVDDFRGVPNIKSEIYGKIWYAFRRNRIEIPYPVRVTYNRAEERVFAEAAVVSALKDIDLFSPLKEDELSSVSAFSRYEMFGAGERIVIQGDAGDTCYFIRNGSVDVVLKDDAGGERFITTLRPGDFFGEMSLLAGEPRSATVIAREDASCLVIASTAFKDIFIENPGLAERLSEQLARRLSELKDVKDMAFSEKEKAEAERSAQKNIMKKIKRFFKVD